MSPNWDELHVTEEYKSNPIIEGEIWADVPEFEFKYQISNYGRARSKDNTRLQKSPQGRMIKHTYKGKLLSIDYSASKFGALNMYDKARKASVQIYDTVCLLFGQDHADRFFLEEEYIEQLPGEIWKDVPGYQGLYEASTCGRVRKLQNNHKIVLKPWIMSGYYTVNLSKAGENDSQMVHRIIASTFIENVENKPYVNHIDGVKTNNNLANLEWVTASENAKHAWRTGLNKWALGRHEKMTKAANAAKAVSVFCPQLNRLFSSLSEASRELNIDVVTIQHASITGKATHGYTFERRK